MIDWGDTPAGSTAYIYWPQVGASTVLQLASQLYTTRLLSTADSHTIQCTVNKGVTYVPIPPGTGQNLAGLFTVDLPSTIRKGHEFNILVSRIASRRFRREIINAGLAPKSSGSNAATRQSTAKDVLITLKNWRYVVGNFQVRIPVTTKEVMLLPEENTLAIMKWRLESLPASNRWYPVLQRYIGYIGARVDGLGGNANEIPASPEGAPILVKVGLRDIVTYKGKVCEVMYDCFGDFEGFALERCCAERIYFKSRQHGIGELVLRVCKERLPIAVRIEKTDPLKIISIILEC